MYPSVKKLNIYQKYYIHHVIFAVIFCFLFILSLVFSDMYDKGTLNARAKQWKNIGKISIQQNEVFDELINSSNFIEVFDVIFVFSCLFAASYLLICFLYSQCLVCSVKLDEAYEFTHFFRKLGWVDSKDRIDFIYRKRFPVYLASKSLLNSKEDGVIARLIPHDVYIFFPKFFFLRLIGEEKLCIASEDCELISNLHKNIVKDDNITEYLVEKDRLEKENTQLKEKIKCLKQDLSTVKKDTSSANEGKQIINDASRFDYFRIAIPVFDSLVDSFDGQKYNRTNIREAIFAELDRHPQHKKAFCATELDKNGELRPRAVETLKKKLGDMAETGSGRPGKKHKSK